MNTTTWLDRTHVTRRDKIHLLIGVVLVSLLSVLMGGLQFPTTLETLYGTIGLIVTTTLIHEAIHVLAFHVFGKGQAQTRLLRDKELRALMIFQSNPTVAYSWRQTITILIFPFLVISLMSLIGFSPHLPWDWQWSLRVNGFINAAGSLLDLLLIGKLWVFRTQSPQITYHYEAGLGVRMKITS